MNKRKNKNVLKRKGFVVTDITNNNISDCQSSNQKSTNRVNNRLKKNRFVIKDIDNNNKYYNSNGNSHQIANIGQQIYHRKDFHEIEDKFEINDINNCNDINETIEDITDCQVIDSEDNNYNIKTREDNKEVEVINKYIDIENNVNCNETTIQKSEDISNCDIHLNDNEYY